MADLVFYGQAGAGKSTCADYMVTQHGYKKMSFAEPLKEIAVRIWGPDAATDREKLQRLGVAVREIDPDAWCRMGLDMALQIKMDGDDTVNDDCRFPNEYWGLKEAGFTFIRVIAAEEKRVDRLLRNGKLTDPEQLNHESETAIMGLEATKAGIVPDYTIVNNYDNPNDVYERVDEVLWQIEGEA